MAQDRTHEPQPESKDKQRRTAAEQSASSLSDEEESQDVDVGDEKAAKALKAIDKVQRKLEPRG